MKLIIGTLLLASSVSFASDVITYHKCGYGLNEIKAIKEIRYNKTSKRLEILKSDKLISKSVASLGGLKNSNYLLSGDLQGEINNRYDKGLAVYKLALDEGETNNKVRQAYGNDLDVTMLISVEKADEDQIILKRGTGYNLYFNHGNLKSILDHDMIKETNGGSVRVLEEIWRVSPNSQAYSSYMRSLNKGTLANGVIDTQTHRIHIERALDYDAGAFSCKRK